MCLQVNNGVYKSGFATTQGAYDRAQWELYSTLDMLETRLQDHDFLVGDRCAESDRSQEHHEQQRRHLHMDRQ